MDGSSTSDIAKGGACSHAAGKSDDTLAVAGEPNPPRLDGVRRLDGVSRLASTAARERATALGVLVVTASEEALTDDDEDRSSSSLSSPASATVPFRDRRTSAVRASETKENAGVLEKMPSAAGRHRV
jgi:hypothetical protein